MSSSTVFSTILPRTAGVLALSIASMSAFAPRLNAQLVFTGTITTIGSGLSSPDNVAVDLSGNVYIADIGNHRVLKETPSGTTYTQSIVVANPAMNPYGVAVDTSGNVYVSDIPNDAVYKETPSAGSYIQSTIASGLSIPSGIAVDASGNVFIANQAANTVLKETPSGASYTQSSVGSGLHLPNNVTVDSSGDVYISDAGNNRILVEVPSGSSYNQLLVIDDTTGPINGPGGVAVDPGLNVLYTNSGPGALDFLSAILPPGTFYNPNNGQHVITGLNTPRGVALAGSGNIYVADSGNNRVLKIQTGGPDFGSLAVGSTSSAMSLTFTFPYGATLPGAPSVVTQGFGGQDFTDAGTGTCTTNGLNYVYHGGDTCTVDVVFKPKFAGERYGAVTFAYGGQTNTTGYVRGAGVGPLATLYPGGLPTLPTLFTSHYGPYGAFATDSKGDFYLAPGGSGTILKETLSGGSYTESTIATAPDGSYILGLAIDGAGDIYATYSDFYSNHGVTEYVFNGTTYQIGYGPYVQDPGLGPIAVDGSGNVYVAVSTGVTKYTRSSVYYYNGGFDNGTTVVGGLTGNPGGLAVDGSGNVFTYTAVGLVKETPSGSGYVQTTLPPDPNSFAYCAGACANALAVDSTGNVYVENGTKYVQSGQMYVASTLPIKGNGIVVDVNGNLYTDIDTFLAHGQSTFNLVKLDVSMPPGLTFGPTNVARTSSDSPQSFTLANIGNAPLVFPTPGFGSNPSVSANFGLDNSTTCPHIGSATPPASLAAEASCKYALKFVPTVTGQINGSIVLTDNSTNPLTPANTTQAGPLSGFGLPRFGVILFSPQLVNFGNVGVDTFPGPITVTVTNNTSTTAQVIAGQGLNGPDFFFDPGTCNFPYAPLAPGASCNFGVYFNPSAMGVVVGSVTWQSASDTVTFQFKGNGVYPRVVFNPSPAAFGNVKVGTTSAPLTISVGNYTGSAATYQSFSILDKFNFIPGTCGAIGPGTMLAAGGFCQFQVSFSPTATGPVHGSFSINTAGGLVTYQLSGAGIP